jgi:hypothetical protein
MSLLPEDLTAAQVAAARRGENEEYRYLKSLAILINNITDRVVQLEQEAAGTTHNIEDHNNVPTPTTTGDVWSWNATSDLWELTNIPALDNTYVSHAEVDDVPVDAATDVPISSNWAYDILNNSVTFDGTVAINGTISNDAATDFFFDASRDFIIDLGDTIGNDQFVVRDSGSVDRFTVDSDGNIWTDGTEILFDAEGTITTPASSNFTVDSGNWIYMDLGDAAGADYFIIRDSASSQQWQVSSDGDVYQWGDGYSFDGNGVFTANGTGAADGYINMQPADNFNVYTGGSFICRLGDSAGTEFLGVYDSTWSDLLFFLDSNGYYALGNLSNYHHEQYSNSGDLWIQAKNGASTVDMHLQGAGSSLLLGNSRSTIYATSSTYRVVNCQAGSNTGDAIYWYNGNYEKYERVSFRAYRGTSNQSISANTWTEVDLNAENWDYDGNFNLSNNDFTCPFAGVYQFDCMITYDNTQGGTRDDALRARILRNGGTLSEAYQVYYTTGTRYSTVTCSTAFPCSSGDTITIEGFSSVANSIVGSAAMTYLSGFLCHPTGQP